MLQHDHDPVVFFQLVQRSLQILLKLKFTVDRFRRFFPRGEMLVERFLPSLRVPGVQGFVDCDPVYPAKKLASCIERMKLLEGFDENNLCDFFRVVRIPEKPETNFLGFELYL